MNPSSAVHGATYYVDGSRGDDQASNGSELQPWRTIQHATSQMSDGDMCVVREGVYRESIKPRDGQTFAAYGNETVVISGCDRIELWSKSTGAFWTAASGLRVREVYIDGKRLRKARYPDDDDDMHNTIDWAKTIAECGKPVKNGLGRVTFSEGLGGKSFDGGFFTGTNGRNPFQANMGRIIRTDGDTLTCDQTNLRWFKSRPGEFDGEGLGYITDHINTLTAEREWHWEDSLLHCMPPSGLDLNQHRVEGRTRIYGFDCSGCDRITIKGIQFDASSVLMNESTNCVIQDCKFTDVSPWGRHFDIHTGGDPEHYSYGSPEDGTAGIYFSGHDNVIRNCHVKGGWGALITLRGKRNTVQNNIVEDANWQCREFAVNIVVNGANHRIIQNTVRNSTAMLIVVIDIDRVPNTAPVIQRNDCRDYGYLMLDGGTAAIYVNGNDDLGGAEISYNLIAGNQTNNHRVSSGIYLDDGSHNVHVHHNVIIGNGKTRSGLFTHKGSRDIEVYNNTFFGQREAGWLSALWEGTRDTQSMVCRHNVSSGKAFAATGVGGSINQQNNREHLPEPDFKNAAGLNFVLPNEIIAGAYAHNLDWKAGVVEVQPD